MVQPVFELAREDVDEAVREPHVARRRGQRPPFVFVGTGSQEAVVREAIVARGLGSQFILTGFVPDLPALLPARTRSNAAATSPSLHGSA